MFNFKKDSKKAAPEVTNAITTIDLNKVVSLDICNNDEKFNSRFFMGKDKDGINVKICFGLQEENNIITGNIITIFFNMINGQRYKQCGCVTKKDDKLISVDLYPDIEKREDLRQSIKVSSKLVGDIMVMNNELLIQLRNISIGGVFIETECELPLRSMFSINIKELDICTKITILRQQKNKYGCIEGYGCQFCEISEKDVEKIVQYINSCLLKERETLIKRDVYNYI